MNNVIPIPIHVTRAAKSRGVGICAYLAAKARSLSPIQCESIMRKARSDYASGKSPARAVSDARAAINQTRPQTAA